MRRITDVPDIDAVFERFAADEKARGVFRVLSARDTMYDRVWRTGANAATHLAITTPPRLGDVPLDSGTCTLWTLPTHDRVQLIVNRQTGQWGTGYRSSQDVARTALQVDTLDSPVDRLTIRVDTTDFRLILEWGSFRWSAPIE